MPTFDEIRQQEKLVDNLYANAVSEDEWQSWNTERNRFGQMLSDYGGAIIYFREKKIDEINLIKIIELL